MNKIKKINKKGSHVGVVLSFVIFVTFLAFFYSIIEPTIKIDQTKQIILDYLEGEFINNLSEELATSTITINKSLVLEKCVRLNELITLLEVGNKMIVKNGAGNISKSSSDGNDLWLNRTDSDETFFKIFSSEEFETLALPSSPCFPLQENQGDYSIRFTNKNIYVFESRINKTLERYANNYEEFKNELNIPFGTEFGFSFINSTGGIIKTDEKNISVNVFVGEVAIQYVDKSANILPGFIDITVW